MSLDNKEPEIRFNKFGGKWDNVILSNIIDVRSGKDYKHLGKGNVPVYGTGGYMLSVDSALSNNEDAIGIGRKGTIDRPYILRAPFWTVDTLFYAIPFSNFNLDFLFCLFQKIDWKKYDESTGVPSLSKIAINNILIYVTSKLEQTAIGNYFQKLDTLINQHQQKHDKLCNIKKAMLEKMFPKPGGTTPEIRFKGFSGVWECNILENICDVRDGTHSSPRYCKIGFPLITSKNVKNGYINYDDIQYISKIDFDEINKRSKVDINDILMGMIGTIGNIALIREIPDFAIKNVALIKDKNLTDFLYIYYSLQSPIITQQLDNSSSGGTQKFVSLSNIRELLVFLPKRKEQTAIGNYFQKLDKLIDEHQQQISKLNNIKQACLSKMFV